MAKTLGSLAVGSKLAIEVNGAVWSHLIMHHGKPSSIYDDSFSDGSIVMMENLYEKRAWHSSNVNSYSASTIHSYLNNAYLALIDERIRNIIRQVKVPYRIGSGSSTAIGSGANGLPAYVFLPAGREVGITSTVPEDGAVFAYFSGAADSKRVARLNSTASIWWLRSPRDSTDVGYVGNITATGGAGSYQNASGSQGIRPTLALPSSQLVTDAPNASGYYEFVWDTVAYLDYIYRKTTANEGRMPLSALFTIPVKDFSTAERVIYLLTNNFNDGAGVVWEEAEYGQEHIFANQSKSADTWRVALHVMAERGELGQLYSGEPLLNVLYEGQ